MATILQFFNHGVDSPYRKSERFGPYSEVEIRPTKITVWKGDTAHQALEDGFVIALRDSDMQWYCDADGDLYTDVYVDSEQPE